MNNNWKWILNRKSRAHYLVAYIYPSRLEVSVSAQAGFATVSGLAGSVPRPALPRCYRPGSGPRPALPRC